MPPVGQIGDRSEAGGRDRRRSGADAEVKAPEGPGVYDCDPRRGGVAVDCGGACAIALRPVTRAGTRVRPLPRPSGRLTASTDATTAAPAVSVA
jgi:hypothetical protein